MPSANHTPSDPAITSDNHIRDILTSLHFLQIQSYNYDGSQTASAMESEVHRLVESLQALETSSGALDTAVPSEILEYVENGRNPEIYTREFVELVQRFNQTLKGREQGFKDFTDILAEEISSGVPELKDELQRSLGNSTG